MISWRNNSEDTQTYSPSVRLTTGNGVTNSVGINIAYEGLNNSTKTLSVLLYS